MIGSVLKKVFGSSNDRRLKSYQPGVAAINALEPEFAALSDAQLAASYRQGEGVGWIMRHRLGGLLSAWLVRRQGDRVVLTGAGALIGILYRAAVATLGLKVTG